MRKIDKIKQEQFIEELLYMTIIKMGYFSAWNDDYKVFPLIAKTCQCSPHKVKRVWYKKICVENPLFVSAMEY